MISAHIPEFNYSTRSFCKENQIELPHELLNLRVRLSKLETIKKVLVDSRKNATKEKIISLLATSLAIGILAAGILGSYYFIKGHRNVERAIAGSTIFTAGLLINIILSVVYIFRWSDDGRGCMDVTPYNAIFVPIIGAFIPVYMTFGKISRLQRTIHQGEQDFQNGLGAAKEFFKQKGGQIDELITRMREGIVPLQQSLNQVKNCPIKVPEAEKELNSKISALDLAIIDLERAKTFYAESTVL